MDVIMVIIYVCEQNVNFFNDYNVRMIWPINLRLGSRVGSIIFVD